MTRRRTAYLGLLVLVIVNLAIIIFLNVKDAPSAAQAPGGSNSGQSGNPLDPLASQARNGLVTEQFIKDQKEALAREYAQVTPGTASETAYKQHCEAFMLLLGEDPNTCQVQIASLAPQQPPPGPSPVPTIVATIQPSVSMTDAWGTDVKVETIPLTYGTDYNLVCNAITGDGKFAVCVAWSVDWEEHGGSRPGKVVLVDVANHNVNEIRTLPHNNTQAFDISADDQWIAWIETTNAMANSDATIYAYNLATNTLQEVTHAAKLGPNIPMGTTIGPSSPRVNHGTVVWFEDALSNHGSVARVIRKLDLDTRQAETLAENAFYPKISWPYVSWLQGRESNPQITTYYIDVLNLQTGVTKTLRDPYTPNFDIYDKDVVWATRSGELVLTDVDETYRQVLMRGSYGENIERLTMNDRLIAWNSYEPAMVWDRMLGRLVDIPDRDARNIFLSGDYLVWQSLGANSSSAPANTSTGATINVVDTSSLRK